MVTRSTAYVNGGRAAFIACATIHALLFLLLISALVSRIRRITSWRTLPALKAAELGVHGSVLISVIAIGVSTLFFNADGNEARCKASLQLDAFVSLAKLCFMFFLLQRLIIVLSLGESARRLVFRVAAASLVVGLSTLLSLLYIPKLQNHTVLPNGDCLIGHARGVIIVAILCDIPLDLLMTVLFLIPVYSAKFEGSQVVARRTAIACCFTCLTATVDYTFFLLNDGKLSFWVYHLLGSITLSIGSGSVYFVMSGCERERNLASGSGTTAVPIVPGTAVAATMQESGTQTMMSGVFVHVDFAIKVDVEQENVKVLENV